jgi:hypothetical protein
MSRRNRKSNVEQLLEALIWSFEGSYLRTLWSGITLVLVLSVLVPWWATSAGQDSPFAVVFWKVANYSGIAGVVAGSAFGTATIWKLWRWERYGI